MNKFFSLMLAFAVALVFSSQAFAATTWKYEVQIVDQFGQPVTSGATVRVKTVSTDTDASVWPSPDTTTGTLTGAVTPDTTSGIARFYSTATSHDVIVHYRGQLYTYAGVTPSSDRRVQVQKFNAAIDLDTDSVAKSAGVVTIPLKGNFFRVTGTDQVRTITSTGHQIGKRVTLLFTGATDLHTDDNIALGNGKILGTVQQIGAGTAIDAIWDGTNWLLLG